MSTTIEKIQRQIAENPILLYMKGSPKLPSCGFSAQAFRRCPPVVSVLLTLISCKTRTFALNCQNTQTGRPSHSCGLMVNWLADATS